MIYHTKLFSTLVSEFRLSLEPGQGFLLWFRPLSTTKGTDPELLWDSTVDSVTGRRSMGPLKRDDGEVYRGTVYEGSDQDNGLF